MQEIIFQQRNAAKPLTGRAFVMSIAGVLVCLAIAQLVINVLISMTGVGLFNVAFYLYAVWLLIAFMRDTVSAYVYTLKQDTLVLERKLGDSTITVVEIPLDKVASLRPVRMAENLHISYRDVMHIDACSRPPLRVRAAFGVSLLSSRLARVFAGKRAQDVIGHVIVFDEEKIRRACTFCPNEALLQMLSQRLNERVDFDERMTHTKVHTLYARALERAFPALYGYVDPLIKHEDVAWAREEIERQKAERKEKKTGMLVQASPTKRCESCISVPEDDALQKDIHNKKPQTEKTDEKNETQRRRRKQG